MKNKSTIYVIVILAILGLCFTSSADVVDLELTLLNFTVYPEEPAPLSTISFTASFNWDNITLVKITAKECSADLGICFSQQIETMTLTETEEYQAEITLIEDRATYIQYYFDITTEDAEVRLLEDTWKFNLTTQTNGNDGNDKNNSLGFEVIAFVIAITFGVLLFSRKRLR